MKSKKILTLLLVSMLLLAACQTAEEPTEEPAPSPFPPTEEPMEEHEMEEHDMEEMEEPMSNIDADPTGQTVVWWHAFGTGANYEGILAVVDAFNSSNEWGITVEEVSQGRQSDLETAVNGAIATGELPTLTMGFANGLVRWYGLDVIAGLNQYIDDPVYGLSADDLAAIYPGPFSSGTLPDGTQVGIPMHQSAQVNFYNVTWAQELGFDSPPTTSAEFKEQACAARAANDADDNPDNDGTGGYVYFPGASTVFPWIWAFDGETVSADGSAYTLNTQAAIDVAMFFKDLIDSGCTISTPSFPNPEFAGRLALFATSSTAGIPFQRSAMEDAANEDVWTAIPFPGPNGSQFVNAFGQMVGVVRTNPDQDLASWLFLRWLTSPEGQAVWLGETAYYPARTDIDVSAQMADDPVWAAALELLSSADSEPNLAAHGSVRGEVQDAYFAIVDAADEAAVIEILNGLNETAAQLVAETQ